MPMRNSAYKSRPTSLGDVLQNPVFGNVVRLFLIVIFGLGGYIWKTEMDHVNKALEDIRKGVNESIERQWSEVHGVRRDVTQLNQDVYRILYRTNELLYELARHNGPRPKAGSGRGAGARE